MAVRDASELIWPAVDATLRELDTKPEDAAARKLAECYAKTIDQARDQAWAMRWIGPLLLQALEALGATPAARAAMTKGVKTPDAKPDGLARLRSAK